MANRKLEVEITGNTRDLDRALGRAETRLQTFGRKANTSGAALSGRGGLGASTAALGSGNLAIAGGVAAGLAAKELLKATQAASDLNEQISKTNVVFGASGAAVIDWSKDLATSFGLAETQALQAASTFGALFHNTGQSTANAAELSKSVVQLGADLASFNNTTVDDALLALRSGLSGEIEPLRRFQVFLTEASVAQQAMADTGKTSSKELTQGEKIMARYKLIVQQTAIAHGDFARTSGGLANQQRILAAQAANLETSLGKVLLPALTQLTTAANEAITASGHLGDALAKVGVNSEVVGRAVKVALIVNPVTRFGFAIKKINDLLDDTKKQFADIGPLAQAFGNQFGLAALTAAGEGGRKGFKTVAPNGPTTGVSPALHNQELDARLSGNRLTLKGVLAKEAAFLQNEIRNSLPADQAVLKEALLGVTSEIKGIDQDIIDDANAKKDAAKKARDAQKAAHQRAIDALKAQAQAFKDQANDIKSAVLDAFDTKTSKIDNARTLADAKKTLKQARQLGGAGSIKTAQQGLFDANRAIQRQNIVDRDFRVTQGPKGPVNTVSVGSVTFNITTNDPDKVAAVVLKKLQTSNRHGSPQGRGRAPGAWTGLH